MSVERDWSAHDRTSARVMGGADVDARAELGAATVVWPLAQIREGARLGRHCVVGRGVYVDTRVWVGDRVKLQNFALVYGPARLADGVFVGPAAVLTNDTYPRSVTPDGELKDRSAWEPHGVDIGEGAAIGAGAVVLAGVSIGRWALAGAGAVVTRDVGDFALVVGHPARQVGWVGHAGRRLEPDDGRRWRCPVTDRRYAERDGRLTELT